MKLLGRLAQGGVVLFYEKPRDFILAKVVRRTTRLLRGSRSAYVTELSAGELGRSASNGRDAGIPFVLAIVICVD